MKPIAKGVLLGVIQLGLVLSLSAKLLYDRATRPRAWARTGPVDPDLPIRGRYLSLRLLLPARDFPPVRQKELPYTQILLRSESGQVVAVPAGGKTGLRASLWDINNKTIASLWDPVAFFIPEHVTDPSRRQPGEELWVEVTLPKKGPPRPLRLGVKKGGVLTPLELR